MLPPPRNVVWTDTQNPTLSETIRGWLGSRRRFIIWYAATVVPIEVVIAYEVITWRPVPYFTYVIILWNVGAIAAAYYIGSYLKQLHPNPSEFL